MRIFVHDYAGHPFQVQLSRALAARGHEVCHAYAGELQTPRGELARRPDDPPGFESREIAMDADYAKHKYSFVRRRAMELAYGKAAARAVQEWRPDVVISSNTPTEPQGAILAACEEVGAKFVFWCQDFYSIAVDKLVRKKIPLVGGLVGAYYKRMERRQLAQADHIVSITEDFLPIMVEEFGVDPKCISVIPNWAPLESLPAMTKENPWATEQGLQDKFVFLYTGTLGMKHNPELLLSLAESFRGDEGVRVVVISEGIGADWLAEKKAEEQLESLLLFPYQDFKRMPEVLATGDVLTGVLEEEAGVFSVPSKVLTYLCARRPILLAVPQVNLAARIIREEEAGLTVAPSDQKGYLAAGRKLYEEEALAGEMAAHARHYAERTFELEAITDRFEAVLSRLGPESS
jgi:colanic acid biosynthesis glycosyl transferase WcaI